VKPSLDEAFVVQEQNDALNRWQCVSTPLSVI